MAFFKELRDQMKANALVSHLEFARDRFRHNHGLGLDHVAAALKAMVVIKNSNSEKALTSEGWRYVVHLSTEVGIMLHASGYKDRADDLQLIVENAVRLRDEAYAREGLE